MTTYYMHTNTGSVDTAENWIDENGPEILSSPDVIEVVLESGDSVPEDFNPAESDKYDWVEA